MDRKNIVTEHNTGIFRTQITYSSIINYSSFIGLEYSVPFPDEVTPDEALDDISLLLLPFGKLLDTTAGFL